MLRRPPKRGDGLSGDLAGEVGDRTRVGVLDGDSIGDFVGDDRKRSVRKANSARARSFTFSEACVTAGVWRLTMSCIELAVRIDCIARMLLGSVGV